MRSAPLKGDCVICQQPEAIRVAVNRAIWPDDLMRSTSYRAAGVRACKQMGGPNIEVKTVTRHADHIEASWREVEPGERLRDNEVPVAADFASVTTSGAELGEIVKQGLKELVSKDPMAFAAFRTKEAIAIAKLGLQSATAAEGARLKRQQQAIDVIALFGVSSGHIRPAGEPDDAEDGEVLEDLRAEVATERGLLAANN